MIFNTTPITKADNSIQKDGCEEPNSAKNHNVFNDVKNVKVL